MLLDGPLSWRHLCHRLILPSTASMLFYLLLTVAVTNHSYPLRFPRIDGFQPGRLERRRVVCRHYHAVSHYRSSPSCNRFRRRPVGNVKTPKRNSATTIADKNNVSIGCASIHAVTRGSGAMRSGSETIFVFTRIIQKLPDDSRTCRAA